MVINYSNLALYGFVLEARSRSLTDSFDVVFDALHHDAGTLMAS